MARLTSDKPEPATKTAKPRNRVGQRFSKMKRNLLGWSRPHKTLHFVIKKAFDELLAIRIIRFFVQTIAFVLLSFAAITFVLGYNPLLASPLAGVGWLIPIFGYIPLPFDMPHGYPAGTGTGFLDAIMLIGQAGMFPYIAVGVALLVPALVGRSFCGWICPFGFVQDVLALTPIRKRWPSAKTNQTLSPIKFAVLGITLLFVVWLGLGTFLGIQQDLARTLGPFATAFWSVLSPSGTFFVIIPYLVITNNISPFIANWAHMLTWQPLIWIRLIFLGIVLALALFIRRPYCRWICPEGALMSVFSRFSLLGVSRRPTECPGGTCESQRCEKECPMGIRFMQAPWGRLYSGDCILCGDCVAKCPEHAVKVVFP
jgi:ferredoxin-type protein NapH